MRAIDIFLKKLVKILNSYKGNSSLHVFSTAGRVTLIANFDGT